MLRVAKNNIMAKQMEMMNATSQMTSHSLIKTKRLNMDDHNQADVRGAYMGSMATKSMHVRENQNNSATQSKMSNSSKRQKMSNRQLSMRK